MTKSTLAISCAAIICAAGSAGAGTSLTLLGTAPPPSSAGIFNLVPFGPDPTAEFDPVTGVASPISGNLTFDQTLTHLLVPLSWATWSHGYMGDVYATDVTGGPLYSLTLTLPAGTSAFVFYVEPGPADIVDFTLSEPTFPVDVTTPVDGDGGAKGFLYLAELGSSLTTITISSTSDFAVGEFSIAAVPEAPGGFAGLGLAGLAGLIAYRRYRRA